MGFNLAWMAVESLDETALLERLGLEVSGEDISSDYALNSTPDGWLVIVHDGYEITFEKLAQKVSRGGLVLSGASYETTMFSELRGYENGTQVWSVTHDPDIDNRELQTVGAVPEALREIREGLSAEQSAAQDSQGDYLFEAPVRLAVAISGFHPQQELPTAWKGLARKGRRPKARSKSSLLHTAVVAEVFPLAQSLGWKLKDEFRQRSDVSASLFYQRPGVENEILAVHFFDSEKIYFEIEYRSWHEGSVPQINILTASSASRHKSRWSHYLDRFRAPEPREQQIAKILQRAHDEFSAIHRVINGEKADPCIVAWQEGKGRL